MPKIGSDELNFFWPADESFQIFQNVQKCSEMPAVWYQAISSVAYEKIFISDTEQKITSVSASERLEVL